MYYINNNNIFAFSNTHCRHSKLKVPENVDIVICAGDAVEDNLVGDEYDDFIEWFASLRCKWKIFVPGNHELSFESGQADRIIQRMTCQGITVLEDAVEDKGSVNILDFMDFNLYLSIIESILSIYCSISLFSQYKSPEVSKLLLIRY